MGRRVGKRSGRQSGLRQALIAQRERVLDRWPTSQPDAYLAALRAGEPVGMDSSELLRLGNSAGIPLRELEYGGSLRGALFTLDSDDRLTLCDETG